MKTLVLQPPHEERKPVNKQLKSMDNYHSKREPEMLRCQSHFLQ